jgi:hypothetical protein
MDQLDDITCKQLLAELRDDIDITEELPNLIPKNENMSILLTMYDSVVTGAFSSTLAEMLRKSNSESLRIVSLDFMSFTKKAYGFKLETFQVNENYRDAINKHLDGIYDFRNVSNRVLLWPENRAFVIYGQRDWEIALIIIKNEVENQLSFSRTLHPELDLYTMKWVIDYSLSIHKIYHEIPDPRYIAELESFQRNYSDYMLPLCSERLKELE